MASLAPVIVAVGTCIITIIVMYLVTHRYMYMESIENNRVVAGILRRNRAMIETEDSKMKHMEDTNLPIYYVNLDQDTERRMFIESHLSEKGFANVHRVPAIYGKEYLKTHDNPFGHQWFRKTLTPGEVGCGLSHFKAIEQIWNASLPYALVVEDDTRFDTIHLWKHSLTHWATTAPSGWTTIQVAHSDTRGDAHEPKVGEHNGAISTAAYLISREGCRKIMELVKDLSKYRGSNMIDFVLYTFDGANPYVLHPPHAYSPSDEHESTIHREHEYYHREVAMKITNKWVKLLN